MSLNITNSGFADAVSRLNKSEKEWAENVFYHFAKESISQGITSVWEYEGRAALIIEGELKQAAMQVLNTYFPGTIIVVVGATSYVYSSRIGAIAHWFCPQ
jgi:hypothetical protein